MLENIQRKKKRFISLIALEVDSPRWVALSILPVCGIIEVTYVRRGIMWQDRMPERLGCHALSFKLTFLGTNSTKPTSKGPLDPTS